MLESVRGNTKNWRPYIDLEHSMCYDQDHWNALTDGRIKYIYFAYDGREQLFDLEKDPGEFHNLADKPANERVLKQWRERMVKHLSERGEEFVSGGKLTIRKKRLLYSPNYSKTD
jgi:arylsulfatase A-like enzyme